MRPRSMKPTASLLVFAGLGLVLSAALSAADDFYGQMDAAMARMHAGMHITSSGDIDRDFAGMMVPHHQGAIDMAILELRYGHDQRLRRLAQEIIVTQGQEIQLMNSILGDGSKGS